MAGVLYVVATPLGNLEDMTFRAVRTLQQVDVVAAEDTRHSRKLLTHFDIHTPLISYFDQSERRRAPQLVAQLQAGKNVALISDAGTPGIADPGYRLVQAALASGIKVVPIPGASAVSAIVSVAGVPIERFAFEGFVPARQHARREFYRTLSAEPRAVVCFEAGRRLLASLEDLQAVLGERDVVVARELTKLFEDIRRGPVAEVRAALANEPVRGEITLVIAAREPVVEGADEEVMRAALQKLHDEGQTLKDSARRLADERGWSRRAVYQLGLTLWRAGEAE
jgi:16S rRNA (cytidine1402-2'-O)-methyltransferase